MYETIEGLTMSPSGILYAMENRMGDIAVRGWDPYSGRLVRQLTEPPWMGVWGNRFALPVTLAAGRSGSVYAVGYEFNLDPFLWGENAGVLRLNEVGDRPDWPLDPWIPYGAGGAGSVSDLGLDDAGDIYLSDASLGILKYHGASGEFLGQVVPRASDGLRSPVSLVFGPDGLLYVLDSGDRIHTYDPSTGLRIRSPVVPESGQLTAGLSMDIAPDGILYVLSASRIQKFDPVSGDVVDTFDLTSLVSTPGVYLSPSIAYFQIPEPTTWVLTLTGLGLLTYWVRRSG